MPFFDIWSDPTIKSIQRFLATNRFFPFFLLVIILFPVVDLAFFSYTQTKQDLTEAATSRREPLAELVAGFIEEKLDRVINLGESLASTQELQSLVKAGKWTEAVALLEDIPGKFPYVDRITLSDTYAVLKADVPHVAGVIGQNFSHRDWYIGVTRTEQPYVSSVYKRTATPQQNVIGVAIPIRARNPIALDDASSPSAILGTLLLQVKVDTLLNWTKEIDIGDAGFIYVIDQKGQIVAHPKYPPQGEIVDFSSVSIVQKALRGESGVEQYYNTVDREERLTAYKAIPRFGWAAFVAQPASIAFAQRDSSLRTILIVYGFAALLMIALAYVLLRAYTIARSQAVFIAREMTASLRDSEERYRKLIETSPDAIVVMDLHTKIIMLNKQAVQLVGADSASEIIGKDAFAFIIPEDHERVRENLTKLFSLKRLTGVEYTIMRKNGTRLIASTSASLLTDRNGKPQWMIVVIRDVTKAKELDHLKDEFISLASHELRTPMAAIRGYLSMVLSDKYGAISDGVRRPLQMVAASTDRLLALVNDILSVSRIETKRLRLTLFSCRVSDIISEVTSDLASIAKNKNIHLETPEPNNLFVQVDKDKLKQILINIIGNALKFTDTGKVSVEIQDQEEKVLIKINDTGIGIAKDHVENLFGKFHQISTQQAGRPAGTGLGLYISRELARAMGGDIWLVQSEPGKGSTFALSLLKAGSKVAESIKFSGGPEEHSPSGFENTENKPPEVSSSS